MIDKRSLAEMRVDLLRKLPDFNPEWSEEGRKHWFEAFVSAAKLIGSMDVERAEAEVDALLSAINAACED